MKKICILRKQHFWKQKYKISTKNSIKCVIPSKILKLKLNGFLKKEITHRIKDMLNRKRDAENPKLKILLRGGFLDKIIF